EIYSPGQYTFEDEMLSLIHAENSMSDEEGWVQLNEEAVIEMNPDVIILTYDHVEDPIEEVMSRDGWQDIDAVNDEQVFQVDTDIVRIPGPRLVEGAEACVKEIFQTFSVNHKCFAYTFLSLLVILAGLFGTSIGTVSVPFREIVQLIFINVFHIGSIDQVESMYVNIVWNIRLPRVILSGIIGASLAVAGAAFQGLLRNPLADPYTLGVSSGASVGAVMTIFFGFSLPFIGSFTLPIFSIVASFLTIFIVLLFARRIDRAMRVETIILTGVIFSSFLSAFISLMIALTEDELRQIISWLLGSVSMRSWDHIKIVFPFFIIGTAALLFHVRELNAMSFGEEQAQHLGVHVERKKLF